MEKNNRKLAVVIGLVFLIPFILIVIMAACQVPPSTSPITTPISPQVMVAPSVISHPGTIEILCSHNSNPDASPLALKQKRDEITATLILEARLQVRQDGDIKLGQFVPSYLTWQQFGPTLAPTEPCTGTFKTINYDWSAFEDSILSGEVEEWIWLYWRPEPITATLFISETGQLWDADNQQWYSLQNDKLVATIGYTFSRSFTWLEEPSFIYLPLILKNE